MGVNHEDNMLSEELWKALLMLCDLLKLCLIRSVIGPVLTIVVWFINMYDGWYKYMIDSLLKC